MLKRIQKSMVALLAGGSLMAVSAGMGGCTGGLVDSVLTQLCNEAELCEDGELIVDEESLSESEEGWEEESGWEEEYYGEEDWGYGYYGLSSAKSK
ncbi:MAG: hypothetical protein HJJLKODD_01647 [Phycisphaerae bacterium]|nr:hypothetical protein [Phycisphaerae bacterium]